MNDDDDDDLVAGGGIENSWAVWGRLEAFTDP